MFERGAKCFFRISDTRWFFSACVYAKLLFEMDTSFKRSFVIVDSARTKCTVVYITIPTFKLRKYFALRKRENTRLNVNKNKNAQHALARGSITSVIYSGA